jgi:Flp pilus assembly protein TadG
VAGLNRLSGSGERGAAAVEFALIVPLLLAVVFGVIGFGRVFSTQIDLSNSAQEAARYAVFAPTVPAPPTSTQIAGVAVAASSLSPALTAGAVTVSGSCSAAGSSVTVSASRLVEFDFVLGTFSRTITGRAVMRCPG